MADLRTEFLNPPTRYRGAPFWSWNDRLQVAELVRQVHDMRAHGMGGFFMHSREGLETEYMGPEWTQCIREVVRAAREAGTYAWLYDEDRWPSGAAGGLVPARGGDAFRAKALTCSVDGGEGGEGGDVLALFRARVEGNRILETTRVPIGEEGGEEGAGIWRSRLNEGEVLLVFRREVSGPSEWFNDDAPADNLNPDSVAAFIDITYEAYRRQVGDEFGKTILGIFTDEPNVADARVRSGRPWVPWTDGLDEYFRARRGYDLLDALPYLFMEGEPLRSAQSKVRHDYWWTISERYVEAFSRQIGAWCAAHNLAFTGHYLCENELGQAVVRGGAVMPHYRHQHVPGIDMLCVQTDENLTVKQCTSVAHQFGRAFVLSETYGCSGWEMTFEEQKWVGDWQYALGVSLRCQHLALYTLRGCRKRDYPPAFNYNTTWWKYNGVVEDYFARVGLLTTQGRAVRDVLVIHPLATAWSMIGDAGDRSGSVRAADQLGAALNRFTRALLAAHYDFDFGDEQIMAEFGRVDGTTLWVNQAPYRVVVLPPGTRTLLRSTVTLLAQFLQAGGKVIAFDPLPTMVEAQPDDALADMLRQCHAASVTYKSQPGVIVLHETRELQGALEATTPRRVSICDERGQEAGRFLYMQRTAEDRDILFVVNNDRQNACHVQITLQGRGQLEEWDPLTGQIHILPSCELRVPSSELVLSVVEGSRLGGGERDAIRFEADFGPAGSRLYVLDTSAEPTVGAGLRTRPHGQWVGTESHPDSTGTESHPDSTSYIGPVCRFRRTDPNALTLDVCRYRLGDEAWSEPMPVWEAQKAVRETLGMRPVFYNGLPQRYKWVNAPHPRDGTPVAFHLAFEVLDVPQNPVFLLVEGAEDFQIDLNGVAVPNQAAGWYLDRSFDRVTLPSLQPGMNSLILSCAYQERMEVEDCYLIGDFGVDVQRQIVREPETLHFGDWCLQGYLHYPGSMVYLDTIRYDPASGERVSIVLGDVSAVAVAVHVNGTLAGHIPWRAANGLEITEYLNQPSGWDSVPQSSGWDSCDRFRSPPTQEGGYGAPPLQHGENEIGIEVVGSPRNMLGPLHQKAGYMPWTDWSSFRRQGEAYTPEYVLQPYGLFGQVKVVRTK